MFVAPKPIGRDECDRKEAMRSPKEGGDRNRRGPWSRTRLRKRLAGLGAKVAVADVRDEAVTTMFDQAD
jgi:hypothetical protein